MYKKLLLSFYLLVLSMGFVVAVCDADNHFPIGAQKNLTNIHLIYDGMPQAEALAVMGDKLKTGYEIKDKKKGFFEPLYIKHPYRIEKAKYQGRTFQIYYFLTQINKPDAVVSDDELTPVLFEKGIVAAKGWDALFELKKK